MKREKWNNELIAIFTDWTAFILEGVVILVVFPAPQRRERASVPITRDPEKRRAFVGKAMGRYNWSNVVVKRMLKQVRLRLLLFSDIFGNTSLGAGYLDKQLSASKKKTLRSSWDKLQRIKVQKIMINNMPPNMVTGMAIWGFWLYHDYWRKRNQSEFNKIPYIIRETCTLIASKKVPGTQLPFEHEPPYPGRTKKNVNQPDV